MNNDNDKLPKYFSGNHKLRNPSFKIPSQISLLVLQKRLPPPFVRVSARRYLTFFLGFSRTSRAPRSRDGGVVTFCNTEWFSIEYF